MCSDSKDDKGNLPKQQGKDGWENSVNRVYKLVINLWGKNKLTDYISYILNLTKQYWKKYTMDLQTIEELKAIQGESNKGKN